MKLKRKFLALMRTSKVSGAWLARELGLSLIGLVRVINGIDELDYDQAEMLLAMFGAKELATVIDWEGMHASCPIG